MNKDSVILVAGASGMVGSAIINMLINKGYSNILGTFHSKIPGKKHGVKYFQINLMEATLVEDIFVTNRPDYVFIAAARVGGIHSNNTYRAQFLYENLQIQNNLIHQSYLSKVKKLIFLGSSCIYPRESSIPIKESELLSGRLEYTNEPYAIAKIAGIKMCENYNLQYGTNFISVMPTNLYGSNDNYNLENSHVLPALIRKFHEAKTNNSPHVDLWGTGEPRREFLHADDLAEALHLIMLKYDENEIINIGSGSDISIKELAIEVADIVGYKNEIRFDPSKPDGTFRKLLDSSKLKMLGFAPSKTLEQGITEVYKDFQKSISSTF